MSCLKNLLKSKTLTKEEKKDKKKAPRQNNHMVFISTEASDANKRAQRVGQRSKRVPMGLSNLIR